MHSEADQVECRVLWGQAAGLSCGSVATVYAGSRLAQKTGKGYYLSYRTNWGFT